MAATIYAFGLPAMRQLISRMQLGYKCLALSLLELKQARNLMKKKQECSIKKITKLFAETVAASHFALVNIERCFFGAQFSIVVLRP